MTPQRLAETLTGKRSAGSVGHLGRTMKALQSTGLTVEGRESMGRLMMESTKRAIQDDQIRSQMGRAKLVTLSRTPSLGSRVAEERAKREGERETEKTLEQARSITEIRETLRKLGINGRRVVPRAGLTKP